MTLTLIAALYSVQINNKSIQKLYECKSKAATNTRSTCGPPQHRLAHPCFQLWGSCNFRRGKSGLKRTHLQKKACLTMLSLAGLLTGRHQLIQRETTAQHVSCTRNACGKQRGFNPLKKKKTILAKPFREPLHNSRHSTPELNADNPKGQQWKNVTKH